jgi:hypothetical protein
MAAGTVFGSQLRRLLTPKTGGQYDRYGSDPECVRGCHGEVFFNKPSDTRPQKQIKRQLNPILRRNLRQAVKKDCS